jgi:hypothetical protein
MNRPPSILNFERLYLASIAVYVLGTILFWGQAREAALAAPQVQAAPAIATMVPGIMIGSLLLIVLASLLFWWLVARARSVVGKWLVVVTEAFGVLYALYLLIGLASGAAMTGSIVVSLLATVLAAAAAVMLFRADATAWLNEDTPVEPMA